MGQQQGGWGGPPPGGGQGGYGPQGGYGAPPGGGYGPPPGGGGYGGPPGGGGYGGPPGGGGYGGPPGGGYGGPPGGFGGPPGGGFVPPPAGGGGPVGVVAWEDAQLGFFGRWWRTFAGSVIPSRPFYASVAQSDNPMPAVTFSAFTMMLMGLVLGLFIAITYIAMGGFAALAASSGPRGGSDPAAAVFAIVSAMGIFAAVAYPIMMAINGFIGPWITGGIHHVILMMLGGATRPYSNTVRVTGYGVASAVWGMIPCIGWLVALVMWVMGNAVGLDETHKCGTGKALVAVLSPLILTGLCLCAFYALVFAAGASSGR